MTVSGEALPVIEPGEQLPDGTTFLEAFGMTVTDESVANFKETLKRIIEAERATDAYLDNEIT